MPDTQIPARPAEPSAARLMITLTLAGLLSGVAIASVHEVTQPRIQWNKAVALRAAVFQVVPGADSMQTCVLSEGRIHRLGEGSGEGSESIYATFDAQGALLGYAIPANGAGFQDAIGLIFGFNPQTHLIVGMKVLESRETPGLGDKIIKDAHFLENFAALDAASQIALVKKGAKVHANEVDAITGATISSKAIVRILNTSMDTWRDALLEANSHPESTP